ncbi:MAG: hypothetical protein BWZ03_00746 [bacterium ADurb.BinA186]|nr:MAG: hypothetical protein BWZ03_00746 [bacterium ADurb.BinA186]
MLSSLTAKSGLPKKKIARARQLRASMKLGSVFNTSLMSIEASTKRRLRKSNLAFSQSLRFSVSFSLGCTSSGKVRKSFTKGAFSLVLEKSSLLPSIKPLVTAFTRFWSMRLLTKSSKRASSRLSSSLYVVAPIGGGAMEDIGSAAGPCAALRWQLMSKNAEKIEKLIIFIFLTLGLRTDFDDKLLP